MSWSTLTRDPPANEIMEGMMNHLGPRVPNRPDKRLSALRNQFEVRVRIARRGLTPLVEAAARDHLCACLLVNGARRESARA